MKIPRRILATALGLFVLQPARAVADVGAVPAACKVPATTGTKPRVVVADFTGAGGDAGSKAAAQMASVMATSLGTAKEDVELTRANCAVTNGAEARALAKAWSARIVVWGQVTGQPPAGTAGYLARVTFGPVGARSGADRDGLGIGDKEEFQLPSIAAPPQYLAQLALGIQFLDRPNVALKYFQSAAAVLPIDAKTDLVPLYRAMAASYLNVPGGPERLLHIAEKALSSQELHGTAAESELLTATGVALARTNNLSAAFHNLNAALALDTRLVGKDSDRVADDLDNLSGLLMLQGDYQNAARAADQALSISTKLHGTKDPLVVGPMTRLGVILTENSIYDKGSQYLGRALEIDKRAGVDWRIPEDLNNVAWNLAGQGQYPAAIDKYREALSLGAKVYPPNHPWLLTCKGNLAWALSGEGKQDEAIPMLRETIAALETPDGAEDDTIAIQLEHLGTALIQQQKFSEARTAYARAQSLNERVLGPEHPTTLWVQRKYARSIAATSGWRQGASGGAVVWKVDPGSPAARLGLRVGDWIVEYGAAVKSVPDLQRLAAEQPSGAQVAFMRDGKKLLKTSAGGLAGAQFYLQGQ
jgi:tetratricopeptide (TPR) repeat protein